MVGTEHIDTEHDVVVREKDGEYYLHVSELGLVARGQDLGAAYADLMAKKKQLIAHFRDSGFGDDLPRAIVSQPKDNIARETLPFLIKTTIVAAVAAGFVIWAGSPITNAVHTLTVSTQNMFNATATKMSEMASPNAAGRRAIDGTTKLAAAIKELTPERKETLRENLRVIVKELRPFVAELQPLFKEPDNQRPVQR